MDCISNLSESSLTHLSTLPYFILFSVKNSPLFSLVTSVQVQVMKTKYQLQTSTKHKIESITNVVKSLCLNVALRMTLEWISHICHYTLMQVQFRSSKTINLSYSVYSTDLAIYNYILFAFLGVSTQNKESKNMDEKTNN